MKTLLAATAIATVMIAGSASAQVLGGQVGGQVGATLPTGAVTDTVQSTVGGAADLTQDTVRDTTDAVQDADPSLEADVEAGVQTDTAVDGDSAMAGADIQTGAMVHGSDGGMLGSVTDVTRDTAGRVTAFTLTTADGATRIVPSSSASVQGDVVVVSE